MWGITEIKVVVLGLVCVGGVGAIAAATSKPAAVTTLPVTYPVVAGNKSDRLLLASALDVQPTVGKAELAFLPPLEPAVPVQPQPKDPRLQTSFLATDDPHDTRASAIKLKPERSRSTPRDDLSTTKVAETQDCRTDGLGSLMRKLNLQPTCSR